MSEGNRYFTELDYVCWERLLLLWLNFYNYLKKKKKKKRKGDISVFVGSRSRKQYGGQSPDSMCILVATVKIIPTTTRACLLLQLH